MSNNGFRIAARGLIVKDKRLLFVSNEGHYWYLPGGRLEQAENLCDCVEREVYEETGLIVKTGKLLYLLESFDLNDQRHKINFYFQTTLVSGEIRESWPDTDGVVQFRRYFSLPEIQTQKTIIPRFLKDGKWLKTTSDTDGIYQGCLTVRGFELAEPV